MDLFESKGEEIKDKEREKKLAKLACWKQFINLQLMPIIALHNGWNPFNTDKITLQQVTSNIESCLSL